MLPQPDFLTTRGHGRDRLVERAAALTGERPPARCRPHRARRSRIALRRGPWLGPWSGSWRRPWRGNAERTGQAPAGVEGGPPA